MPQKIVLPHKMIVAVDTLIFSVIQGALKILLIQIGSGPYQGKWALPGGTLLPKESLERAAERSLRDKAGVEGIYLEQLATFGDPKRDVRERSISIAYFALVNSGIFSTKTTDYYSDIRWHDADRLPKLAFDHQAMIQVGKERLKNKLGYSNIAYALLPKEFTLTELQLLYEAILGKPLDKRNFRKKIQEVKLVQETGKIRRDGPSRPAKLYSFTSRQPKLVPVLS